MEVSSTTTQRTSSRGSVQRKASGGGSTRSSRATVRGTGYAEGAAALSPGVDAPPATVQLDTGSPALNPATLSWSQKQSAVRYNKRQGFTLAQIRGFQNAVRTADDGVFGPNTVSMIARYQAEHGLDVDGKIGPQTRAALQAAAGPVLRPADDEGAPETVPTVTSGQLSANFSLSEFASHDGAATPQLITSPSRL